MFDVRLSPNSGAIADMAGGPRRAMNRHGHSSICRSELRRADSSFPYQCRDFDIVITMLR
jgi:hypothetical protein